jgi:ATP-dependent DNA ligase
MIRGGSAARAVNGCREKREMATLDVVVTAVEYGHGRRAAVLGDYPFAVRDGTWVKRTVA